MTKRIKPTKDALIRVRVTTKQKDVYEERGGPPALREWLDNPQSYDADILTVAYLDGVYTGKKQAKKAPK